MRGMNSAGVDLIHLDPSFTKANYAAPIGSQAAGAEFFKDTWTLTDVNTE